ncbi:MAG: DNA primase [Limnochordia bacterium]|nr:DNA primase [Bacillota bacterium]
MAGRIPEEVIEEIKLASDIVALISDYLPLKRTGKSYKGLCPFHNERTPSFNVNPDDQFFYCFGCGAGGNIFTFVMKMEHVGFVEAVELVARRFGIRIPETESSTAEQKARRARDALLEVNKEALAFFVKCLWSSPRAVAYLRRRGISEETARKFQLGYAPGGGRLVRQLQGAGLDLQLAVQLGLARIGRGSLPYDYFRDRLMFPIADERGEVVGFGGRALEPGGPKYLNSPESPLFSKGNVLYGLHLARGSIRRTKDVILVEGYMDVIALHQGGLENAVASLGTALTDRQGELLRRQAGRAFIAYDADAAGKAASLRSLKMLGEKGLEVRVVELPTGEDPDSFVRGEGKAGFDRLMEEALPLIQYRLRLAMGKGPWDTTARVASIRRAVHVLAEVDSPAEREVYMKEVARQLGISIAALEAEIQRYGAKKGTLSRYRHKISRSSYNNRSVSPGEDALSGADLVETELVRLLLEEPQLVPRVKGRVSPADFGHPALRSIVELIFSRAEEGKETTPQDIAAEQMAAESGLLAHLIREDNLGGGEELADKCIRRLKEYRLSESLTRLEEKLASPGNSAGFLGSLLIQYKDLKDSIGNY